MNPIPQSLYIHIPWCVRKCPYCDFNSHALRGQIDETAYIRHLLADFTADYDGRPIYSIFIGGGTPSLLSGAAVAALLDGIAHLAPLAADCEITLEANPGTFEQEKFAAYRAAGVNRLSIGVQSFADAQLQALGRIHSSAEAVRAVTLAQQAGFTRINLDVMFALPGQDVAGALDDLRQAIALAPEHISWYQLTLEPNTAFYANPPVLPDSDTQIDIYEAGSALLTAGGYRQYETSAWRAGEPCRHNLNYWQYGDYLGIGAGAHGKQTRDGVITRRSKYRAPAAYQKAAGAGGNPYSDQQLAVARDEQAFEFMMNALRLKDGVPTAYLTERTALSLDDLRPTLDTLVARGLLAPDIGHRLQTTPRGFALLNNVLDAFL
ncbi:Oxygen-independent coproporphyrinogen-III oxidase [Cardiobacterium valvarum]|uniref:Heme chaperone HemW n=1 Tax=Cardiobacterium valvarum TaxID=194702 RepID=A0A381EF95_9GAMM|nr:radical SAM family heme chaperone HemW [Cardiobacterium valvarum]SUX25589.1 Oxygen-independent coproporphyrinogen-III oxidase [Cardiobacterium valvarum]